MSRPHILIVGGAGVFGSRLARLLARRQAFRVSLGGRTESRVLALQRELRLIDEQGEFGFVMIDRDRIGAERLKEIACAVVVDCSGPFQLSGTHLIEAAIGARCHYVDIADSRAFVAGVPKFDSAARAVAISVISGASSTPALTHAVLDTITSAWLSVDSIDIAIVPGNRTPKGRSVIEGILSWVGQRVRVFRDAGWEQGRGWSGGRWVAIEGLPKRWAMLVDVPDLDLIPARFSPRVRAGFDAGMELPMLNWLIGLAAAPVRWGLLKSARTFAGLGTRIALSLDRFGTADGGMLVEAAGQDARGEPRVVRWSLRAAEGDGPYVPVAPAAAVIEMLTIGHGLRGGARSAAGVVTLEQIKPWFEGRAIETKLMAFRGEKPLYRRVMGDGFERLPEVTRRLHRGRPAVIAEGEAVVAPAENAIGRFIARRLGVPVVEGRVPVRVVIESREGREHWTRFFADKPMRSVMSVAPNGLIEESFGPVAIRMRLVPRGDGLDMVRVSGRLWGVPLPGFLLPKIKAEERMDEGGRHRFDVEIGLPLLGRLVAYRGYLVL
ncbi:MAG: saccharopine dehydrogenase [Devosia sp.]|uniref:SDR family oxidoreductase n=1 Tax=Devosia sp. TaxID=1871048 RepID=UPI00262B07D7|nr:SDR family oxidoreductase [Devosia sp.]MDB5539246.1 saccharopine dehydrogenase [Devosia sp.]